MHKDQTEDSYNNMSSACIRTYQINSMFERYSILLDRAVKIVKKALSVSNSNFYIAFSGGKDSLVLLDIVTKLKRDTRIYFFDSGAEFPDTLDLINFYAKKYNIDIIKPKLSILEIYRKVDAFGYVGAEKQYELDNKLTEILIKEPSRRVINMGRHNGVFMGLRKEESRVRRYMLNMRSELFFCKYDQIYHCNPLLDFTAKDVWSYILTNHLRYNRVYDKKWVLNREQLRVGTYAGCTVSTIARNGRWAFLKKHYPEQWNKFALEFPFIKSYC